MEIILQPLDDLSEGRGIHGKQLGPQIHIQRCHTGAVPEGAAFKAPALEQILVVADRHGDNVHHLAGVGDDGVVPLRGSDHHVGAADMGGDAAHEIHVLFGAFLAGGQNKVGSLEHGGEGVLNAGELGARHGMAADEVHRLRQHLRSLHNGGLDAAHISDQSARLEGTPVFCQVLHNAPGVHTEIDDVRLRQHLHRLQRHPVADAVAHGILRCLLTAHHAHHGIVLKAPQGRRHRAADQAKAHDGDDLFLLHLQAPSQ